MSTEPIIKHLTLTPVRTAAVDTRQGTIERHDVHPEHGTLHLVRVVQMNHGAKRGRRDYLVHVNGIDGDWAVAGVVQEHGGGGRYFIKTRQPGTPAGTMSDGYVATGTFAKAAEQVAHAFITLHLAARAA